MLRPLSDRQALAVFQITVFRLPGSDLDRPPTASAGGSRPPSPAAPRSPPGSRTSTSSRRKLLRDAMLPAKIRRLRPSLVLP